MLQQNARDALGVLAALYLNNQKPGKALKILEGLAVLSPGDVDISKNLAYAYLASGDAQGCVELTTRLLVDAVDREDQALLKILQARALAALGEGDRAKRMLEDVLKAHANS